MSLTDRNDPRFKDPKSGEQVWIPHSMFTSSQQAAWVRGQSIWASLSPHQEHLRANNPVFFYQSRHKNLPADERRARLTEEIRTDPNIPAALRESVLSEVMQDDLRKVREAQKAEREKAEAALSEQQAEYEANVVQVREEVESSARNVITDVIRKADLKVVLIGVALGITALYVITK